MQKRNHRIEKPDYCRPEGVHGGGVGKITWTSADCERGGREKQKKKKGKGGTGDEPFLGFLGCVVGLGGGFGLVFWGFWFVGGGWGFWVLGVGFFLLGVFFGGGGFCWGWGFWFVFVWGGGFFGGGVFFCFLGGFVGGGEENAGCHSIKKNLLMAARQRGGGGQTSARTRKEVGTVGHRLYAHPVFLGDHSISRCQVQS